MLTPLIAKAVTFLPLAPAPSGPTLNSQAVVTFIVTKILPIIFGFIGVLLLLNARKQRMSDVFETIFKVVIAVAVIASGPLLYAFGGGLVKLFIN
jgi:hypothetical protein